MSDEIVKFDNPAYPAWLAANGGELRRQRAHTAECEAALGSAAEWLERMELVYSAHEFTTDRDREKVRQLIEWIDALLPKPPQTDTHREE